MKLSLRKKEIIGGYLFLMPWIIGVSIFFLYNIIQVIVYSFNNLIIDQTYGGFHLENVGQEHYHTLFFVHGFFVRQLVEALINLMWEVPLIIFFSLFIAILLNREFMGRSLVRTIFFLPVIIATPAVQWMLGSIMDLTTSGIVPANTPVSGGLSSMAIASVFVDLGMPINLITFVIDAINRLHDVIRMAGIQMLIFLAALQSIPAQLYEVSKIEGATAYETFWKVTLPLISPFILVNIIYTIINNFAHSPVLSTVTTTAFQLMNFGLGSAMSLVSSLAVCLFLLIIGYLVSKKMFYHV